MREERLQWRLPAVLVVLTALSTTAAQGPAYAVTLLAILGAHEMGHYLTARRFGVPTSLPHFIPLPPLPAFSLGTLGAVIRMDGARADRRQLLAIGAAGPIAGFLVAVPALMVGLLLSEPASIDPTGGVLFFGSSLLSWALETLLAPPLGPGEDLIAHPVYVAAWAGILVTALNLLPMGQLDGGHIVHAIAPQASTRVARAVHRGLVVLGLSGVAVTATELIDLELAHRVAFLRPWLSPGLLVWALLAGWMGLSHPPTSDDATPLRPRDGALAALAGLILILCFMPSPIHAPPPPLAPAELNGAVQTGSLD